MCFWKWFILRTKGSYNLLNNRKRVLVCSNNPIGYNKLNYSMNIRRLKKKKVRLSIEKLTRRFLLQLDTTKNLPTDSTYIQYLFYTANHLP